jgi:hypothetical protein
MPPPPPPPQQPYNPYAQQAPLTPGPPAPYAQQQSSPPGPYAPYAQQPVPSPYGAPHPYGWGVPPMAPPPPKKRRVGLVLGIVGGAVGVVVAIVVALALIGSSAASGFPEAKFTLTVPKTLLDGRFELAEDLSDSQGRKIVEEADGSWDAKITGAVVGRYGLNGDATKGVLVTSGMYGRFKQTDEARRNMLKGAGEADGVTVSVGPKDFPKDGSPMVSCEVLTQEQSGTTLVYPACAWADDNTAAMVAVMGAATTEQNPSAVPLAFYANVTLQVRSESVKPIDTP